MKNPKITYISISEIKNDPKYNYQIKVKAERFDSKRHRIILKVNGKYYDQLENYNTQKIFLPVPQKNIFSPFSQSNSQSVEVYAQIFDFKTDKVKDEQSQILETKRQLFEQLGRNSFFPKMKIDSALPQHYENYWHANRKVTEVIGPKNSKGEIVTKLEANEQYTFIAKPNKNLNNVELLSVKWAYSYDGGEITLFKNNTENVIGNENVMTCSFHAEPEKIKVYAYFFKPSEKVSVKFSNFGKVTEAEEQKPVEDDKKTDTEKNSRDESLVWSSKVSPEFCEKVIEICKNLWGEERKIEMANGLMAVMNVETSGTFAAHQIMGRPLEKIDAITKDDFWMNKKTHKGGSRAVGLIQFTQDALEKMGEFTSGQGYEKLHKVKLNFAKMGEIKQLEKVQKYFEPMKESIKSPEEIYLAVFAPSGLGKKDDYILYKEGTEYYEQNKSVDEQGNKDGRIQRSEILARYYKSYKEGRNNKAINSDSQINRQPNGDGLKCPDDSSQCFKYADVIPNPTINNQGGNRNKNRFKNAYRIKPDGTKYQHTGVDILTNGKFMDIHSLLCGEVVDLTTSFKSQEYKTDSLGNNIVIKSKDFDGKDVWIIYCHLDSVSVKKNDKIKHNQKIGISGCTGNAGLKPDGTRGIEQKYWHCHIEASRENKFYKSDKRIDPEQFMKTKFDKDGNPIKN